MLLASVPSLRLELGFDDMTDINAAITAALNSAEPQLAVALNTSFTRDEATDTFWVRKPAIIEGKHHETEFWLRRGFLSAAPSVTGFPILDGSLVVNLEKGTVRDWTTYYRDATLVFSYTAGFAPDPSNAASYNLTQVPSWLQEAAKLLALARLADSPPITEAGIKIDVATIKVQLDALLGRHTRYAPMALYPL